MSLAVAAKAIVGTFAARHRPAPCGGNAGSIGIGMHRRSLIALPLVRPVAPAFAQVAGRLPPEAPDAAPRVDAGFSAGLLAAMEAGEALVRERLGTRFTGVRVIRRQVPPAGWSGVEAHYLRSLAAERRWRDAGVTAPSREREVLPPQGWTDGTLVLVLVAAHTTRAESGLLPFSILTNLRDA